jgi:hypothetical protein
LETTTPNMLDTKLYPTCLDRVKAGLALLKEDTARGNMPVLNSMYYAFVSYWKKPLQSSWEALIDTHQDALMEGQMEFAMTSALYLVRQGFMCGTNLEKQNNDCISVANKMVGGEC